MKKLFQWIGRNEKHLSTAAFVGSFLVDLVGYAHASLPWIATLFTGMFLIAAMCILVSHYLHRDRADAAPSVKNPFYTLLPIIAQFFIGGLLSGCFILYTRAADFLHSWPFIALLAIVFVGNELFSKYRERLTFQTIQLFFALYLYAIFELPIARGRMDSLVFVASGFAAIAVFALFVGLLWVVGKKRLMQSLSRIGYWCAGLTLVINAAYFTGVMPPLPLSLKDAGIYHTLVHTTNGYNLGAETQSWNPFAPDVEHVAPGTALYAYSAVFAPVALTTPIVHRWEYFDTAAGTWVTKAAITFPISGGRDAGYRGYTQINDAAPGKWRVSVETTNGAVLGTIRFTVESTAAAPVLHTEVK